MRAEWRGIYEAPDLSRFERKVGDVVEQILKRAGLNDRLAEETVIREWSVIVGDFLAGQSKPTGLRGAIRPGAEPEAGDSTASSVPVRPSGGEGFTVCARLNGGEALTEGTRPVVPPARPAWRKKRRQSALGKVSFHPLGRVS